MQEESPDILANFNSSIPVETSGHIWNITKWSRFTGVAGFLLIGFLALCMTAAFTQERSYQRMSLMGGSGIGLLILLSGALVTVVLLIFLLRFAIFTKRGITNNDQEWFNEGIAALKYYFIVNGIAGIVYCLFIMFAVLAKLS